MRAKNDHKQEDKVFLQGLVGSNGGIGNLSLIAGTALVRAQASPNMTVIVAKERFYIPGTESTSQGMYHGYNDGDVTVTIAASSPTLPRIDIIVANVRDAFYSEGLSNDWQIKGITGTPNSSPVAPSPPVNAIITCKHIRCRKCYYSYER